MSAPSVLTEERRLQLDSIVDRATNDGLPPEEIQFIVNDFKRIHGTKAAPKSKGLPRGEITDKGTFSFGSQDVSPFDPTKANIQDEVTGQSVNPFAGVKAGASAGVKKTAAPTNAGKQFVDQLMSAGKPKPQPKKAVPKPATIQEAYKTVGRTPPLQDAKAGAYSGPSKPVITTRQELESRYGKLSDKELVFEPDKELEQLSPSELADLFQKTTDDRVKTRNDVAAKYGSGFNDLRPRDLRQMIQTEIARRAGGLIPGGAIMEPARIGAGMVANIVPQAFSSLANIGNSQDAQAWETSVDVLGSFASFLGPEIGQVAAAGFKKLSGAAKVAFGKLATGAPDAWQYAAANGVDDELAAFMRGIGDAEYVTLKDGRKMKIPKGSDPNIVPTTPAKPKTQAVFNPVKAVDKKYPKTDQLDLKGMAATPNKVEAARIKAGLMEGGQKRTPDTGNLQPVQPKIEPKPAAPGVKNTASVETFNHETSTLDDYVRDLKAGKATTDQHFQYQLNNGDAIKARLEADLVAEKAATAPTASPKPDAPKTTVQTPKTGVSGGISRAAMVDQAEQLGTDMPKSIQGEPNAVVMARAKEAVVSGKFDPYAKAKQLTDEGRPPSRDEAAGFIEYRKAQKEKIVDANRKLESKTLGQKEREALLMERAEAIAEANQFNKLVIRPRGETGGVLQMFREESGVVWHDLDDVKLEIERVTGKAPTNLPRLSDAVKQARKAKEFLDDVTANGYVRTVYKNRAEDVAKVRSARASAKARLQSRLSGTFKEEMSSANIPVKLLWNVARQAPGVVKDVLEISKTVIQEFGFKLADKRLYNAIRKELDGIEITDDEIRALLGRQYDEYKPSTPTDYSKIRAQAAKEEDAIAALEGRATRKQAKRLQSIADRKRTLGGTIRTGITVAPENRIVDPVVENARLKLAIMEQRVQGIARLQGVPKSRRVARDFLSTARVLKLGSDFGVLLRQGMYGLTHPKAYAASLQKILPAMKGDDVMYAIEETSNLKRLPDGRFAEPLRRRAGLSRSSYFTDPEEAFLVQWAKKVPGLKTVVGKLERGQTAFLNTLRNEMFDSFAAAHPKADIEELEKWASFVNSATGRSNMKQVPHFAEWIMTSPRYEISRWEMVGRYARSPKTMALALKSPAARRELMSLGTVAGTMIGALKLGEAGGLWETNLDPTSADFLKIRIGNKVFDFTAGISPRVRSAAMLVAASSATTVPARVKAWLNGERYVPDDLKADGTPKKYDPDKDFSKEFGKMATRTVSPGLSALPSAITNRGLTGYLLDEGEGGLWLAAPLIVAGAAKGYKDGGVGGAVSMAIPEFLGAGTNTYPKKGTTTQSTKKPSAPPLSLAERGF